MIDKYSLCDISINNGEDGKPVWIIIKGDVYDVTKFVKEHPGGEELLLEYAGKEATKAFNEVGHSIDAIQQMKSYKIGVVDNDCQQKCGPSRDTKTQEQECCRREKKQNRLFSLFKKNRT
ncbi:cytochrome b5 [Musca vetustissima]|uniref:cytochrome b5 n=1 Tax=Musca vetustissima TaxID=27455 RepID=UPI002AB5EB09|nr:cytochrome b5 [Musca vetustissima]